MPEKFLDLDAFLEAPGKIKFRGKTYEIPDVAVKQFLEVIKVQQQVLETQNETEAIGTLMELIGKLIPTLPREELEAMTLKQLARLLNFAIQDLQSETPKNVMAPMSITPAATKKGR